MPLQFSKVWKIVSRGQVRVNMTLHMGEGYAWMGSDASCYGINIISNKLGPSFCVGVFGSGSGKYSATE